MRPEVSIDAGRAQDAPALAALFIAARATAMPWLPVLHEPDDVQRWMERHVLGETETLVARAGGEPLGFLALDGDELDHLYIRPDAQREGIGSALVGEAKARRPGGLELWAFQRNHAALAFYARHGFSELYRTDGADNEEREPDVRLAWR